MHDIKWIRDNPDAFDFALKRRGLEPMSAKLIALDQARRNAIMAAEGAQARRNSASKEIGDAKKAKDEARAAKLMAEVAELKTTMPQLETATKAADEALATELAAIPNLPLPAPEVPDGSDEHGNVQRHVFGKARHYGFAPKPHDDLGGTLGMMDFETAAKLSGARFVVLKKGLARLERAIGQFMLDLHTNEHGYTEINPPLMVRDEVMFGTGQLPKFRDDQFGTKRPVDTSEVSEQLAKNYASNDPSIDAHLAKTIIEKLLIEGIASDDELFKGKSSEERERFVNYVWLNLHKIWNTVKEESVNLWLIPTAEVPLTNLVRKSILEEELPMRLTALTPCFRAEAGAAGRDTRGMIRQHQFTKVELVSITTPETSKDEHERMLACAEEVLRQLDLHYRVVTLCAGDMGFSAQKTYDIEVWMPGQGEGGAYREISSCSVCGDFQARRMDARYRASDGKPHFVHTLNGSGTAVGRALIAVMETYQQQGGSIAVPDVLQPYMGGVKVIDADYSPAKSTPAARRPGSPPYGRYQDEEIQSGKAIVTLPVKPAVTSITLPEIGPITATMLEALTKALRVERTILPSDDQIAHLWSNLPRLIDKIPPEHRSETIVRMCVAVSAGLFDSAVNYAWNAAVIELRNKVRSFGLPVIPQVLDKDFDETALLDLKDAELLNLCLKLNLITEDGFFLLNQNREIRNNFSAAHPTMGSLDEYEFLNFLNRCGSHALTNEKNPRGVDIKAFIAAIKALRFTKDQATLWVDRLSDTFEAQREALFGTLHGIYCDPASGEESRLNALQIFEPFKTLLSPKSQSDLVDRHQDYKAKGDEKRSKASSQFFEKLGLLALLGDTELHAIFTNASGNLLAVHNAMNNFYNEPPFARRLAEIMNGSPVPVSAQFVVVEAVTTCAVGNPYGVSNAAAPWYQIIVKSFSPNEVAIMLNFGSLPKTIAGQRINTYPDCRNRFAALVNLISSGSVPTQSRSQYEFWISEAKKK